MSDSPQPYRVLARKYRPQTFSELIGQEAMVQTLANAIKRDRLAHAFLLTGVRGVGKTSTARLIAKALNCIGPDGQGKPTIDPCGQCEPCVAIAEGRHIDVVEMDAASHTGIDDVREIIEAVRYAAVSARYKLYIIDEAHMLSKQAWNGFLKTLEEPPAHVKFLFATTEVNKIPVTILSRCQRFDLRRIPGEVLQSHFARVAEAEGVQADPAALALVATAAEGSARDGLSMLDQAIAHADLEGGRPAITAEQVRDMLGLADKGTVRRLFQCIVDGDAAALLDTLSEQHRLGVDAAAIMADLLELIHAVTLAKSGRFSEDPGRSAEERAALEQWSGDLGFSALHRLWQLMLKGHGEVASAVNPRDACDMALLRVIHAASMPDPSDLARLLADGATLPVGSPSSPSSVSGPSAEQSAGPGADAMSYGQEPALPGLASPAPVALPTDFRALVNRLENANLHLLALELSDCVGLVRYDAPEMELRPLGPTKFTADQIAQHLREATGQPWLVRFSDASAEPSLREQDEAARQREEEAIRAEPAMQALFEAFPGAELLEVEPARDGRLN